MLDLQIVERFLQIINCSHLYCFNCSFNSSESSKENSIY
ncbi:MAG: hypothetical protein KAS97_04615 [Candidatus Aminicenantes bacterium]|nr:hypothetical protein [Candidatus Aminicenantes bacterium]